MIYTLRGIDAELWDKVKALALEQRRTIRQILLLAITKYVTQEKGKPI